MARVIVVGAGTAGLAAAFRLQERGVDVLVLEAEDEVGGKVVSIEQDGFRINRGAALLPTTYTAFARLANDSGAGGMLRKLDPVLGVYRNGKVNRLHASGPKALLDGIRTPLLSPRAKLDARRLVIDALRARNDVDYDNHEGRARHDDESVREYCDRRLTPEIRDNLIEPLLNGLFVADAMSSSKADLFFTMGRMLGGTMYGTPAGIDFLHRHLATRVPVRTGARVDRIESDGEGARVTWTQNGVPDDERVDGVVLAVPGPFPGELYPQLDPRIQGILTEGLEHADTISVRIALKDRPEDELAMVVPGDELDGLGSIVFEHVAAPDCAPPGKGLVAAFFSSEWCDERAHLCDDAILGDMLALVDPLVPDVANRLEFARIDRWAPSNPIFVTGKHKLTAELDRLMDPSARVQLAGDYTSLPLVNACVVSGEAAATRLAGAITERGTPSATSSSSAPA